MATGLSATAANAALDAALALGGWVQLHTGDPGSAGTANVATETTRKQATWRASASGATSQSNALTWTSIAGSQDATHFTVWTASTNGTFLISGTVTANAYTAGDTFTVAIDALAASLTLAS